MVHWFQGSFPDGCLGDEGPHWRSVSGDIIYRGFRLKANNQVRQISLIDNVRNMVGIMLNFNT